MCLAQAQPRSRVPKSAGPFAHWGCGCCTPTSQNPGAGSGESVRTSILRTSTLKTRRQRALDFAARLSPDSPTPRRIESPAGSKQVSHYLMSPQLNTPHSTSEGCRCYGIYTSSQAAAGCTASEIGLRAELPSAPYSLAIYQLHGLGASGAGVGRVGGKDWRTNRREQRSFMPSLLRPKRTEAQLRYRFRHSICHRTRTARPRIEVI